MGFWRVKKRYANRFMGVTPSTSQEVSHREREVLRVFAQYTFRRVLDIGCGDGNFSLLFGKASGSEELFGVDISETAVKLASSKGVRAFQVNVDLEDLPFEGDSFDAIFCGETLEHLFDPDHLIEEAFRVLKPGGYLLAAVKAGLDEGFLEDLLGIRTEIYFSLFTEDEIAGVLRESRVRRGFPGKAESLRF